MQIITRWFAQGKPGVPRRDAGATAKAPLDGTKLETARTAVRDVLSKHGIPTHWLACELLPGQTRNRTRGSHIRLVMREWQPTLLPYTVPIQRAILARLIRLDPHSPAWFAGVSWRYDVVDDSTCPSLPSTLAWSKQTAAGPSPIPRAVMSFQDDVPDCHRPDGRTDFRATEPKQPR